MNHAWLIFRPAAACVAALMLCCEVASCNEIHVVGDTTAAVIAYTTSDYAKAVELLSPLANKGEAVAQLLLGRMYHQGEGVAPNHFTAFEYYRKAAEQGETEAQFQLGIMYRDGLGTAANGKMSLYWFKRAAERGMPDAHNAIGELFLYHLNIARDYQAALEWFHLGAELDSAAAMYNIGVLYSLGIGVEKDEIEAFKWFDLAAAADPGREHDKAVRARIALAERLMPLQIWDAKIKAETWMRVH